MARSPRDGQGRGQRRDRDDGGDDLVDSYNRVLRAADEQDVDLVIHAGDLFDREAVKAVIEASDITNKEAIIDRLNPSIQVDKDTGMQVNRSPKRKSNEKLPTPEGFVNVLEHSS